MVLWNFLLDTSSNNCFSFPLIVVLIGSPLFSYSLLGFLNFFFFTFLILNRIRSVQTQILELYWSFFFVSFFRQHFPRSKGANTFHHWMDPRYPSPIQDWWATNQVWVWSPPEWACGRVPRPAAPSGPALGTGPADHHHFPLRQNKSLLLLNLHIPTPWQL